ncbi:hypothetical protein GZH53_08625 [Flavihumibacter sp. R14]|nr:hypothetical protein [Flavihumibacter soli]
MNHNALKAFLLVSTVFSLLLSSCEKEPDMEPAGLMWVENSPTGTGKPAYDIKLENKIRNKNGTYTWIWSVINTKPGDGTPGSGTVQDLQSWGFSLGSCADLGQVISGSFSPDGVSWHNFNPEIKTVEGIPGGSGKALMFEQGTVKNQKSYYKLLVTRSFSTDDKVKAVFKSGKLTGSGTILISGIGCPL